MDSAGNFYQGIFNQSNLSVDSGDFIISGLADNKVVGAVSSHLTTDNVSTDWLTEGPTNQYFTTTRARAAFSSISPVNIVAGEISLGYSGSIRLNGTSLDTIQPIETTSSPQFARLLNSSLGTFSVIAGTNAGANFTGDRCVLIGDSVMQAASASQQTTAVGNSAASFATGNFNTAYGANAGFALLTGEINTICGANAGRGATPLTTGSGCVLLGAGANTSSSAASNEIVIGFGTGAGNNTAKIYASSGLAVSNLTAGVLKSSATGLITSGATTDDLTEGKTNLYFTDARAQGAFSPGTNITLAAGLIATTSNPTFAGLTLTGLTGILKATAGTIATNATTDDLLEGTTNLYFTNNRARAAITAIAPIFANSGIISLGYNTTNLRLTGSNLDTIQDINTVSSPQFTRLLSSSLSTRNVLCGTNSGAAITSGVDCVAIGHNALTAITTAGTSTAVGSQALRFATGGSNTGVGFYVLRELTTGNQNTAFGAFAGSLITTGSFNTLMGLSAGYNITSGSTNYCLGLNAGYSISSSSDNIALGAYAMGKNLNPITVTNGRNIAIGHYASHSLEGTPSNNIAIGYNALYSATATSNNTIVGSISATSTTTAINNTVVGASCMNSNVTGSNNTIIGYNSGQSINGGVYNIHIGVGCQASALNASSEVIIAGTSGTTVGKGAGTCYISSPYGLYYYNPAICYLYGTGLSNGRVQWAAWDTSNVPTKGFYFSDYGNGTNTVIVPEVYGHYEITINGAMLGNGSNLTLTFNNTNIRNYNVWYQSFSSNGIAYSLSATMIARPYTVVNLSGFEFQLTNMTLWGGLSLYVCIKFIGF